MKRRAFLVGTSALALGQLASGCNNQQASLKLRVLKESIPAQLRAEFPKVLNEPITLKFDIEEQLQDLFTRLQAWKRQTEKQDNQQQWSFPFLGSKTPAIANLVTLGDYWLETAIQEKLIQPLDIGKLKGWQQLPRPWQDIVRRDRQGQLNNSGLVWGAPYRWGTTVIAYNRDKFKNLGWKPKDWSDLWRPELRDRISLLDQPREVIGLTLKKLGSSYNIKDLTQVKNLKKELLALHKQVKFYSSKNYLQPLLLDDTWVAVGWSTDVLAAASSYRQIEAVIPQSGTALWTDIWVQPTSGATQSNSVDTSIASLTNQWIDFCWQPKSARQISLFSPAASPIILSLNPADLPNELRDNPVLVPSESVLDKSEFLQPLPTPVFKQYQALWQEIRQSKA